MENINILATVKLDDDRGRCELFWYDGGIHYRSPEGKIESTETSCNEENAAETIQFAWGGDPWDLQWA